MNEEDREKTPAPVVAGGPPPTEPHDEREAELAAARERDGDARSVDLGSGLQQRLIRALTGGSVMVTLLALLLAIVIGGMILALSDEGTRETLGYVFSRPSDFLASAWATVTASYAALFRGAVGSPRAITETLVLGAPLILTGLAVAVPLRAGLFNIGGEGQFIAGGVVGGFVGFALEGLPMIVHLPLALVAGVAGGALIGWIPGILKASTGAHEVISTIMLNNILATVSVYLLTTSLFQIPGRSDAISQSVLPSARIPRFTEGLRGDYGILLAIVVAVGVFWLMERSTVGFELNAVGANANAARSAGMDAGRNIVRSMTIAGMLAGLAGAVVVLGLQGRITPGFSAGIGFDGITVALLARGGVGGSIAAGLLIGGLQAGGRSMQAVTQTSLDLVVVIQGLIIIFIAAPKLVRAIFRIRTPDVGTAQISKGWGA